MKTGNRQAPAFKILLKRVSVKYRLCHGSRITGYRIVGRTGSNASGSGAHCLVFVTRREENQRANETGDEEQDGETRECAFARQIQCLAADPNWIHTCTYSLCNTDKAPAPSRHLLLGFKLVS